jgi:hypothetical protein
VAARREEKVVAAPTPKPTSETTSAKVS